MRSAAPVADDEVDLNPLIDVITLLLVFFILGGRLSADARREQITVPPARTAAAIRPAAQHLVVNLGRSRPGQEVAVDRLHWPVGGDGAGWAGLRGLLDRVWERSDKRADPATGRLLAAVSVEIRADGDASYRSMQELQQVLCDSVDPAAGLAPRRGARPFTDISYTTRPSGEGR
jgi:biopolymer transport protein ExbD